MVSHPPDERISLRPDPWRIAWNILGSDALLASALLALGLLLALTLWLPQAPDSVSDPVAFSRWMFDTQARFGGTLALLRQIGLFSIERSALLRTVIALVALCLVVRLASAQAIWNARRLALADAGRIAVCLGGLLMAGGLAISDAAGWRVSDLTLGIGQATPIGHDTPYTLRLDALGAAHVGHVALLRETDLVSEGNLMPGQPMRSASVAIFMSGTGPAIRASATLTNGQPLRLQTSATSLPATELLLLLTRAEPDRFFAASDAGLVVQLSRDARRSQSIRIQAYRSRTGTVIFDGGIPSDGQLVVENVVLALGTEDFAALDIAYDPGAPIMLAGMVTLAVGLALASLWSARRLDLQARPICDGSPITPRRWLWWVTRIGWEAGLAILSAIAVLIVVQSLTRFGMLWPAASAAPVFLAAWLTGCATAVLPHRAPRWITLALAVIALAIILIWPGLVFPPGS